MEKKGGESMRISVDISDQVIKKIDQDAEQHNRTRKAEIESILLGYVNTCLVKKI